MKAIILVAGTGKRMRPFTDTAHKTLLRVGDKSLIEGIIDPLLKNEITDITLVTGYQAEELKAHLYSVYPSTEFHYVHNDRFAKSNNVYSVSLAFEHVSLNSDILLIESDIIFDPSIIERLLASPHPNVAVLDQYQSGMDGTVVQVSDGLVTDVIPPHRQDVHFNFDDKFKTLNIYRFSKGFCNGPFRKLLRYYSEHVDDNVYYELIIGVMIYLQKETVHALILQDEPWAELDAPNDLIKARFKFDPSSRKGTLDSSYGGFWNFDTLDFCYIRNTEFPTGAVLSELHNSLDKTLWNYSSGQDVLNRKLAYYLLCNENYVTLLNGASQVYPVLRRYFQGKKATVPCPTFGEYSNTFPEATPYFDEVGLEIQSIANQSINHDVVVFVNPNNPTGTTLPTIEIHAFAQAHPNKYVLVDESFIEFSCESSILKILEEKPLSNVLLIKSLSKVLGVPGLRLGYLYSSNDEFNSLVRQEMPIWSINAIAERYLEIILKHREAIQDSFSRTIRIRQHFSDQLKALSIVKKVFPSGGNFLLISLQCDQSQCADLVDYLLEIHGIYVKDVSIRFRGNGSYLRLAVKQPKENNSLVEHLGSWVP